MGHLSTFPTPSRLERYQAAPKIPVLFVGTARYLGDMKKCPVCQSTDGVREIIYGMPDGEPDESKYLLGGCLVSDDMPDYKCINCNTSFYKGSDRLRNRFIDDGSGITIISKSEE
jgi:hypothetical protein